MGEKADVNVHKFFELSKRKQSCQYIDNFAANNDGCDKMKDIVSVKEIEMFGKKNRCEFAKKYYPELPNEGDDLDESKDNICNHFRMMCDECAPTKTTRRFLMTGDMVGFESEEKPKCGLNSDDDQHKQCFAAKQRGEGKDFQDDESESFIQIYKDLCDFNEECDSLEF